MDDKKVPVITKDEAISKLRMFQSLIASRNWEDKECVVALQMGIRAIQQPEIVRCKDCRFAHMTYDGLCKQCDNATDDDDIKLTLYLPGDFYCAFGERKEGDGDG